MGADPEARSRLLLVAPVSLICLSRPGKTREVVRTQTARPGDLPDSTSLAGLIRSRGEGSRLRETRADDAEVSGGIGAGRKHRVAQLEPRDSICKTRRHGASVVLAGERPGTATHRRDLFERRACLRRPPLRSAIPGRSREGGDSAGEVALVVRGSWFVVRGSWFVVATNGKRARRQARPFCPGPEPDQLDGAEPAAAPPVGKPRLRISASTRGSRPRNWR